jgi:hypothetical protein
LPALGAEGDTRRAPIRFKNLLRRAEERLVAVGYAEAERQILLAPVAALLAAADFWQHQPAGLAVFRSPTSWQVLSLSRPVPEQMMLGNTFYLTPVLPLVDGDGPFFLLALSQNEVRFFQGSREHLRAVDVPPTVPPNLAEVARFVDAERQPGYHTDTPRQGSGRRSAVFFGHGGASDYDDDVLRPYCQQIDHGLRPLLGNGPTPLVLAGVESLLALYRAVNTYPHLLPNGVIGNPEAARRSVEDLHARGWAIAAPVYQSQVSQDIAQYRQVVGTGRASGDPDEVVPAAMAGRVAVLFLASGAQRWGRFDLTSNSVSPREADAPDAEELLNLAAVRTLRNGGVVHVLEPAAMPAEGGLAALYRY